MVHLSPFNSSIEARPDGTPPSLVITFSDPGSVSACGSASFLTVRRPPSAVHFQSLAPMNRDDIPDIRDGLTRKERVVLYVLNEAQKERGDHNVPTPMLWGRVCEHFYISPEELSAMLARLGARK